MPKLLKMLTLPVLLSLLAVPVSGQEKFGWIVLDKLDLKRESGQLQLEGRVRLPDETIVYAAIYFKAHTGVARVSATHNGQIAVHFKPLKGRISPGKYAIRLEVRRQDQTPEVLQKLWDIWPTLTIVEIPLVVGEEGEAEQEAKTILDMLARTVEGLRQAHARLDKTGTATLLSLTSKKFLARGGEIPKEARIQTLQNWDRFCRIWEKDSYHAAAAEFQRYRGGAFAPLFPETEEHIRSLLSSLRELRASFWADVALLAGADVPQHARTERTIPRDALYETIHDRAGGFYRSAGLPPQDWYILLPGDLQKGEIQGNVYRNKSMRFEIAKPEGWVFQTLSYHPGVPLRLKPPEPVLDRLVFADVEIKHYPEARDEEDLVEQIETETSERWPGFQKISARQVSVNDAAAPGGVRRGYEMKYHSDLNGVKYRVEEYDLFDPSGKRTLGVLCVSVLERADEFRDAFRAIFDGFKVMDQPARQNVPANREKGS